MQVGKSWKGSKNVKGIENESKQGQNQAANYQKGMIRNMCEEIVKPSGKKSSGRRRPNFLAFSPKFLFSLRSAVLLIKGTS